jgi:hypothetical protein
MAARTSTRLDSPANGMTVWALAIDPRDPRPSTPAPAPLAGGDVPQCRRWCPLDAPGHRDARVLQGREPPADPDDVPSTPKTGTKYGSAWRKAVPGAAAMAATTGSASTLPQSGHRQQRHPRHQPPAGNVAGYPATTLVLTVNAVYTSTDDGPDLERRALARTLRRHVLHPHRAALCGRPDQLLIAIGDATPGTRSRIYRSQRPRCDLVRRLHAAHGAELHLLGLRRACGRPRSWCLPAPSTATCSARPMPGAAGSRSGATSARSPRGLDAACGAGARASAVDPLTPLPETPMAPRCRCRPRIRRTHIALFVKDPFASRALVRGRARHAGHRARRAVGVPLLRHQAPRHRADPGASGRAGRAPARSHQPAALRPGDRRRCRRIAPAAMPGCSTAASRW